MTRSTTTYSSSVIQTYYTYDGLYQPLVRPGIYHNVPNLLPKPPLANAAQSRQDAYTTYWLGYVQFSVYSIALGTTFFNNPNDFSSIKSDGVQVLELLSNASIDNIGIGTPLVETQFGNIITYTFRVFFSYVSKEKILEGYTYQVSTDAEKANYMSLVTGYYLDSRSKPPKPTVTPAISELIRIGFYRQNGLEPIPGLVSIDWVEYDLRLIKNKQIVLPLIDVVLGTMYILRGSSQLVTLLSETPVNVTTYYQYSDYLPQAIPNLFAAWDQIFSGVPDIISGNIGTSIYRTDTSNEVGRTLRGLGANNDWWGQDPTIYPDINYDPAHPMMAIDNLRAYNWHISPQTEGVGTLIMDSTRIIQTLALLENFSDRLKLVEQALESNTYGQDPDHPGEPRVVNLGWLIKEIGNKIGIRRKPNGTFLTTTEQAKYKRNRLNSPKWSAGEYETNGWGRTGYALRHLPTAYKDGFRQDNQYDLVHDIPQLIEALIDQLDLGQGLQHTSEIRIKVGKQTQSYANVGQLMTDLAIRMIEMEALVEKLTVMGIETGNSVRELYPGIGIPVATKSVGIDIGGKLRQVYYPGFQAGKQSIADRLVAIAVNLGILIGQFMPSNAKASWNPFNRKPKG